MHLHFLWKRYNKMEKDLKVHSIKEINERKINNMEVIRYELKARDAEGCNEIVIKSASAFDGFDTKQIITVAIKKSQTAISDFEEQEAEIKERKKEKKKKDAE
jgi:hypothetical protein